MTEHYELLQLGYQLYQTGKTIQSLQRKLNDYQKRGVLGSPQAQTEYHELEIKMVEWRLLEQKYLDLKAKLHS